MVVRLEKAHGSGWGRLAARLIMMVAVVGGLGWSWLHLWDHYHPAAPAERRLWSGEPQERIAAIDDLGRFGRDDIDVALPALINSLRDTDAQVRAAAAVALVSVVPGRSGQGPRTQDIAAASSALLRTTGDPKPTVRAAAYEAVWMLMSVAQVAPTEPVLDGVRQALFSGLRDPDAVVRLAAIRGLGTICPRLADEPPGQLVAALKDSSEKNRDAAVHALSSFHIGLGPLLPSLVRSLDDGTVQSASRLVNILEYVRPPRFTPGIFPGLVAALSCRNPTVVRAAVAAISAFKNAASPVVPDLARTMDRWIEATTNGPAAENRPALDIVAAIAECLEVLGPSTNSQDEAVAALANGLQPKVDPSCRVAAAKALGRFRPSPALFKILSEKIEDRDDKVRIAVMWAIDHADFNVGYQVPKTLAVALEDSSALVRGAAAAAMGHAGMGLDPFVPTLLRHAQHDADGEVQAICSSVLESCAKPPKVTTRIIPDVIKGLENPDGRMREALCTLLSRFGTDATPAIPALLRVLKDTKADKTSKYRWIAVQSLGEIAPNTPQADQVVSALIESLQYPDWSGPINGINSLARFGPKAAAAIPILEKFEHDNDGRVSKAATEAVASIKKPK